jgi:glycosyltransferase involved in cell wall biosynthesis
MKIAMFHELTPLSGARKVVEEYAKILNKNNQVDLFYVDVKEDLQVKKIFNNIFFFKFNETIWKGNNWKNKLYKDSFELINLYLLHKKIAKIINSGNYDYILVNPSRFTQAPFLLRFLKGKVAYYCQEPLRIAYEDYPLPTSVNFFKKNYELVNRRIRKLIDSSNLRKTNLILVNSKFSKHNIDKAYNKKSFVCYLGVDPNKFKPMNVNKIYDLLFIGAKEDIEGYDLIGKTLSLYEKPPRISIISRTESGKGISEVELINQINKSKIVLALSRHEPFGLVPIEAMSCGVSVIAVEEGGFKESVVDSKTGYLIKRDTLELKQRIDKLLADDKIREDFGKAGRERIIEMFTWEKSAGELMSLLSKYADKK